MSDDDRTLGPEPRFVRETGGTCDFCGREGSVIIDTEAGDDEKSDRCKTCYNDPSTWDENDE